jgi:hypothetical protein
MKYSASAAQNTPVYVVLPLQGIIIKKNENILFRTTSTIDYKVFLRSLYDHIIESAELTKTPNGVGRRLHIVENDHNQFELRSWEGDNGQFIVITKTNTQEEADDTLFAFVYDKNFLPDESRDCSWHETEAEAIQYRNIQYASLWQVNTHVAASILRKKEILENHRAQLAAKPYETVKNEEAILAAGYENLIPCIPNERYDDTTTRVINALNKRIDIAQLHAIVRTLRRNWYKTEQSTSNSAL